MYPSMGTPSLCLEAKFSLGFMLDLGFRFSMLQLHQQL